VRAKHRVDARERVGRDEDVYVFGRASVAVVNDRDTADDPERHAGVLQQGAHLTERDVDRGQLGAHRANEAAEARQRSGGGVHRCRIAGLALAHLLR
jgi:hypothetical protein